MINLLEVMEDLYNSEINFEISSFWDAGYTVQLGDSINGFKDGASLIDSLSEVAEELVRLAVKHYPESEFAKKYRAAKRLEFY